jgi:hypothetical protein
MVFIRIGRDAKLRGSERLHHQRDPAGVGQQPDRDLRVQPLFLAESPVRGTRPPGRLDDPRQHQITEHPVPAGRPAEPQHVTAAGQGIKQVPHPRGRDRQRPAPAPAEPWAKIQDALPGGQALPCDRLQHLQLGVVQRGPGVLDIPRLSADRR